MKKIGKYEILEVLGEGGMGIVYKAFDTLMEREVAIKVLSERVFNLPEIKERFYREARSAGKLSHENITIVHELGEIKGQPYIVMEYLSGIDLRFIIDKKASLTLSEKLNYALQICKGLEMSHSKDIIHRDIKPANIRVLEDGKIKIMDFGIAKPLTSTMTQTGVVMGTPHYMSPEQIKGQTVDKRSDIFSFGAVFYELLTYKKPFSGSEPTTVMYKIVHENPEPIEDLEIEHVSGIKSVILKCLKKNLDERYQSFSEVVEDLGDIIHIRQAEEKRRLEEKRRRIDKLISESKNYLKKQNFKKALEVAEKGASIDPDYTILIRHIESIKQEEEKKRRRQVIEERLSLAEKHIKNGLYENCVEVLQEVLKSEPEHKVALRLIEEAKEGKRLEEEKKKIDQLLAEGREQISQNNFVKATKLINDAIKINPQHPAALNLLEAIRIKKEEEENKKKIVEDRLRSAQALIKEKQYDKALPVLEDVLRFEPKHEKALKLIEEAKQGIRAEGEKRQIEQMVVDGRGCLDNNDFNHAEKIVENILRIKPRHPEALKLLEAIKIRRAEEEKKEKEIKAQIISARKLIDKKNYYQAVEILNAVLKISPGQAEAKDLLNKAIEETNKQLTEVMAKTKLIDSELAETRLIDQELAETIVVETEVEKKKPPVPEIKEPKRKRAEKPRKSNRIFLLAALLAMIIGAGLAYRFLFLVTPTPSMGYVSLNILPWAEITKIENSANEEVALDKRVITPCRLTLPAGRYTIYLANPNFAEPLILPIEVKNSEIQEVKRKMPGFDYKQIISDF
jgi:serine/threonine protein kinase